MDIFFRSVSNAVFLWSVKNKNRIITAFIILHILQAANIVAASFFVAQISTGSETGIKYFELGGNFGTAAALVFLITIIPGIAKRFRLRHPVFNIIQTFRRHFGIATFLLVLTHYAILRLVPSLTWQSFSTLPLRETLGFVAFCFLFLMFLTSNDFATRRLGAWWGRLHKLAYLIVWLVFAHVALDSFGLLSILIGVFAIAEWTSLIFSWLNKNKIPVSSPLINSPQSQPPSPPPVISTK